MPTVFIALCDAAMSLALFRFEGARYYVSKQKATIVNLTAADLVASRGEPARIK